MADKAGSIIGVDATAAMLAAFAMQLGSYGPAITTIQGSWPDVAAATLSADVVVCHHVAYNVPDLASFAQRLTDHARVRVVMELTERHPMSRLNDLWLRFHGLKRPEHPTAGDVVAILRELGYSPRRHDWQGSSLGWLAQFVSHEETGWLAAAPPVPACRT